MFNPRLIVLQPTAFCNIDCTYCYLTNRDDRRLMSSEVLDAVCAKIMSRLDPNSTATLVWHAGEPTAAPIGWYEDAYPRLSSCTPPSVTFAMQSNGIAIDERWIDLFRRTGTQVSISLDGPQRFHDARRLTRNGRPTWKLALRGLKRLQEAGYAPSVITVLHPQGLDSDREYYEFYRDNDITDVSFSIDEMEGHNTTSSFDSVAYKPLIASFIARIMRAAYRDQFPLHIREVERIAHILTGQVALANEQVEPWASIVVAADGKVSTYSPEFMEVTAPDYDNFVFGNVLDEDIDDFANNPAFQRATAEIEIGVAACKLQCRYFAVCGGGAPVNKYCESHLLSSTETDFCRFSVQASADALRSFLSDKRLES